MSLLKLRFIPFRYKIIFTLSFIVIITSLISFQFLKRTLVKEFDQNSEENVESIISVLKESYLFQMKENDGKVLYSLLHEVSRNHLISNAYLLNHDRQVVFSTSEDKIDTLLLESELAESYSKDISISKSEKNDFHTMRAVMRVQNKSDCYSCHSSKEKVLGYLVLDLSLHEIADNLTLIDNFSYIYTIVLIIIILVGISFLHSNTIKKSLFNFQKTISMIEEGNLNQRIEFEPEVELGKLAKSFNNMLDRLETAQSELELYHKHELLNAKKLATIGEMAASVAHEIRNPLAGISSAVEILCEEVRDKDNKPIFEEVRRQINRVNKTLTDLLQFSRPVALDLQPGNINNIIKLVVSFIRSQVKDKKIVLNLNLAKNMPEFKFDHLQIENCLINLGMNALAAIKKNGEIVISSHHFNKKEVIIEIADDGIGIPKENIEKIFNPFYTTKHQGTGLGLAIVSDILKRHSGEITVEENKPEGTIFQISLPVIT